VTTTSRFLSTAELRALGLAEVGADALVDRAAILVNPGRIRIGSRSRIDALTIITAGDEGVTIGCRVHLGAGCQVFGGGGPVVLEDFSCLSGRTSVYTTCDDFTDGHLTNPTVPMEYRRVQCGPVTLRRHAVVGCGSVLLPDVELGRAAAVGALSLVRESVPEFEVWCGVPARRTGPRNARRLVALEAALLAEHPH
jgi:acetyltransferase-like isoleucine patch superfamily enzyme